MSTDVLPEFGIVIPFYNGDSVIRQCLDSIGSSMFGNTRVYIVDNSSVATQIEATASRFSFVRVIRTRPSIGFGKASNIGANVAASDGVRYLVFLNQDTILAPHCLREMFAVLDKDKEIGIVGPVNWSINFQT